MFRRLSKPTHRDVEASVQPARGENADDRRRNGNEKADHDHGAEIDTEVLGVHERTGCGGHETVRDDGPSSNNHDVPGISPSGLLEHGPGEWDEQVENRIEEDRDRQDETARQERHVRAVDTKEGEEPANDPVGSSAFEHAHPDHRRQCDHDADAASRRPEGRRDPAYLVGQLARGQKADYERRRDESKEGVQPQDHDQTDHGGHADEQNEEWVYRHPGLRSQTGPSRPAYQVNPPSTACTCQAPTRPRSTCSARPRFRSTGLRLTFGPAHDAIVTL